MRYYWVIKNTLTNEYFSFENSKFTSFNKDLMYAQFFTSKENAQKYIEEHNYKNCKLVKIKAIYEEIKE